MMRQYPLIPYVVSSLELLSKDCTGPVSFSFYHISYALALIKKESKANA